MVQFSTARLDAAFAALSDATRRGVLEQLGGADASISELADRFHMTLTGMKKARRGAGAGGPGRHPQDRARAHLQPRPGGLEQEAAWIEARRRIWTERFDALDQVVAAMKRKEQADGRQDG
ncbi:MAG: ArsR family transcriptional regulator [Caulobacteraceae bacterium]